MVGLLVFDSISSLFRCIFLHSQGNHHVCMRQKRFCFHFT
jgi:hypothetical protein